jgi:hypothetical protein
MPSLRLSPENPHPNHRFCRRPSTAQGIYPQSAVDLDDALIDAIDVGMRRIIAEEAIALQRQVQIEWALGTNRKFHRLPPAACEMAPKSSATAAASYQPEHRLVCSEGDIMTGIRAGL